MGFVITSGNLPEKMYPGMIITCTVKPLLEIKMKWVTEIAPDYRNRRLATEMTKGLFENAFIDNRIKSIIADTL